MGDKNKDLLPTKANIEREFASLLKEKPKMFLFYFSGHGFMNNARENIIAPIDIQYQSREKVDRYVSITSLVKQTTGIPQSIFLLDACREQLTKNTKALDGENFGALPADVENAKGVAIMMGTSPGGFSYENENLGGGIFTHFLVRALNGGVQDEGPEYVTFGKLKEYLEKHIPEYTTKEVNKKQIPYTAGDYTGNFLLAVGRPKNQIESKIAKYLDKGKNLRLSRILFDTQKRKIQQNFFLIAANGTYSMSDLDGVQKMSYDYGKDFFAAKQYNLKGEIEEEFTYSATDKSPIHFTYLADNVLKQSVFTMEENSIIEMISYPKTNQSQMDPNQIRKIVYKTNEKSQITDISHFNAQGKLTDNTNGIAQIKFQYNKSGKRIVSEFLDSLGKLKPDANGIARYKYEFNSVGNKTLEEYHSPQGDLISDRIARKVFEYESNLKDKVKSEEYFDSTNKLKEDSSGIAKRVLKYDSTGNILSEELYDAKNELKSNGFAVKSFTYDANRNLISEEYLDQKRKPIENRYSGIALFIYEYDSQKRKVLEKYFDSEKKPAQDRLGVHARKFIYNEKGLLEKEEYIDKDGKLAADKNGISRKNYSYNSKKERIIEEYLDKDGNRKGDSTSIAKRRFTYTESGKLLTKEFFNKYDTPEDDSKKVFKYSYSYDEKDNLVSEEQFDINQNLIKSEYSLYFPNKLLPHSKTNILIKLDKYLRPLELNFFD